MHLLWNRGRLLGKGTILSVHKKTAYQEKDVQKNLDKLFLGMYRCRMILDIFARIHYDEMSIKY